MMSPSNVTNSPLVFQAKKVSKTYRQGTVSVSAISNVDLSVTAGEFVVVAGPSGSGKTTLLNLMGGLDQPDEGSLRFAGVDLGKADEACRVALRRERLGFIFVIFKNILDSNYV